MSGGLRGVFAWTLCITTLLATAAVAAEPDGVQKRRVLALYDSSEEGVAGPEATFTHRLLEHPLNWLGLAVTYHDVQQRPLPEPTDYRGVIVWMTDDVIADPIAYCDWLQRAAKKGTRLVLIGDVGALRAPDGTATPDRNLDAVYRRIGLDVDRLIGYTENPFVIRITDHAPDKLHFETDRRAPPVSYTRFKVVDEAVDVWRSVERTDIQDSRGAAVCVGPNGGFALYPQMLFREINEPDYHVSWDVDPFAFLAESLGCADMLRPDVTTRFGARAALMTVYGEGFANPVALANNRTAPAGRVIQDEVLAPFGLPATVGILAGAVSPEGAGDASLVKLMRETVALPNVEAGCLGWAGTVAWAEGTPAVEIPGYKHTVGDETTHAIAVTREDILPEGAPLRLYLWAGDAMPPERALKFVENAGLPNFLGGNPRLDKQYTGIANLAPLTRPVGDFVQYNAVHPSENEFTEYWSQNFGGYTQVLETFRKTESPRRLTALQVAFHYYSADAIAGLNAVKEVLNRCAEQPLCWGHASEYVAAVQGFETARVGRTRNGIYWIEDYGRCRTARLDHCTRHVDLQRSRSVLGYTHHGGSLYIALDAANRAEIALSDTPPAVPHLRTSTAALRGANATETTWRAEVRLFGAGRLLLQGFPAGEAVSVRIGAKAAEVTADPRGVVEIALPRGDGEWVEVSAAR